MWKLAVAGESGEIGEVDVLLKVVKEGRKCHPSLALAGRSRLPILGLLCTPRTRATSLSEANGCHRQKGQFAHGIEFVLTKMNVPRTPWVSARIHQLVPRTVLLFYNHMYQSL